MTGDKVNFKVLIVGHSDISSFLKKELLATHEKSNKASWMKLEISAFDDTAILSHLSYDFVVVAAFNNVAGRANLEHYLLELPMKAVTSKKVWQVLMATEDASLLGHEAVLEHREKWPVGITFLDEERPTSVESGMKRLWQTIIKAV